MANVNIPILSDPVPKVAGPEPPVSAQSEATDCDSGSWAIVIENEPDPAVVVDPDARDRIASTGLPWRVRDRATEIELLLVPPGSYWRGSTVEEIASLPKVVRSFCGWEHPKHVVTLTKPFYLGRYEVTVGEWKATMGEGHHYTGPYATKLGDTRHPIVWVTYSDVAGADHNEDGQTFMSKTGFRLPTEAEWEYACRAGTSTLYSCGQSITPDDANYLVGTSAEPEDLSQVGSYPPNPWGFHDMHGNAHEMCADVFRSYQEYLDGVVAPTGPVAGYPMRVLRGGGVGSLPGYVRSAFRNGTLARYGASSWKGFRVARDP
jgi:formylglycine-generating enzyme required for sulfatase activity